MHIKDDNLYFDNGNYISINGVQFVAGDPNNGLVTDNIRYFYSSTVFGLSFDSDISSYKIRINIAPVKETYASEPYIINVSYNEMLCVLKDYISKMCDIVLLCKQYIGIIKLNGIFYIQFNNIRSGKEINMIKIYGCDTYIRVDYNKSIKNDNTIVALSRNNDFLYDDLIVIDNNIVRTDYTTIIYPGSYNFNLRERLKYPISFGDNNDSYITILNESIVINYYTPLPLLMKFVENAKLFNNIDNVYINNEYDILRYL